MVMVKPHPVDSHFDALCASELGRVLVCPGDGGAGQQAATAVRRVVPDADVSSCPVGQVRGHRWLRAGSSQASLLVVVGDVHVDVVGAAVEHGMPVAVVARSDLDAAGPIEAVFVRSEVVLRVRPHGRPGRLALGVCSVEPVGAGVLRVRGDDGLDVRLSSLTVVNRDPFDVAGQEACRFEGADQIGLCWTRSQVDADRLAHRRTRLEVAPVGAGSLVVDCDRSRFRAVSEHLTVGPGWQVGVAELSWTPIDPATR